MREGPRPLFLHCGWRTAGTWLWSLYRQRSDVMGFYEPLNESLATLSRKTLPTMRPGETDSGHPDPDRPYFEEFAPLLAGKACGAVGYRRAFAYDTFFADPDVIIPGLWAYLDSLVQIAQTQNRIAVLKFCRSLGRVAWMRRRFPHAAHVVVLRDPWSQWQSAWRIFARNGNPYFIVTPLRILQKHREHRVVASMLDSMRLRLEQHSIPERHGACCKALRAASPRFLYRVFVAFWTSTTLAALQYAEDVIDTTRLADSPTYRVRVEQLLENRSGLRVDLSTAQPLRREASATDLLPFDVLGVHHSAIEASARLHVDLRHLLSDVMAGNRAVSA